MAQSASPRVTICVPVFNAAKWVAESLASIVQQSFADFDVLISDDASNDGSAEICGEFTSDPRFRLVVQPTTLGWAQNCNWLLNHARGEYFLIHCHDDILDARCIETLLQHIAATPTCCVAFPDIKAFGSEDHVLSQQSISGNAFERAYDVMAHHYNAVAFNGLIRTASAGGGLQTNSFDSFAADTTWLMRLARAGELHRVKQAFLHKRYHQDMTHFQWTRWDEEKKIAAWCTHCLDILNEALRLDLSTAQQWLLVFSALQRLLLVGKDYGPYGFIRDLPADRKVSMVVAVFNAMRAHGEQRTDSVNGLIQPATDHGLNQATATLMVEVLDGPIEQSTKFLKEANADRAACHEQINMLTNFLKEANADRAVCHEQINALTSWLKEANADRVACHEKIDALMSLPKQPEPGPWQWMRSTIRRMSRKAMRRPAG